MTASPFAEPRIFCLDYLLATPFFTRTGARIVWLLLSTLLLSGCQPEATDDTDSDNTLELFLDSQAPFSGWDEPGPEFAILISGEQHGYLEPCGCTERRKGGLARRDALVADLKLGHKWPLFGLDLGGLTDDRMSVQTEIKQAVAIDAMREMGYEAIAIGPEEMRFGPTHLFALSAVEDPPALVSANLNLFDQQDVPRAWRVVEQSNRKIGITSVYGKRSSLKASHEDITWKEPADVLDSVIQNLQSTDLNILLSHAHFEETEELIKQFPQFDLVVCTGGGDAPATDPRWIGNSMVLQVGHKGMHVGVVGYFGDQDPTLRYQLIELNEAWEPTDRMQKRIELYQDTLRERDVISGLYEQARSHPEGATFVGSEKCGSCHKRSYRKWLESKHSKATAMVIKEKHVFDPECITCHSTGWRQQEVLPWKSGFQNIEKTPQLVGNGCENCHGPGSLHVEAEESETEPNYRNVMSLDRQTKRDNFCTQKCHDLDNSPNFDFSKYWPQIQHPWKD